MHAQIDLGQVVDLKGLLYTKSTFQINCDGIKRRNVEDCFTVQILSALTVYCICSIPGNVHV